MSIVRVWAVGPWEASFLLVALVRSGFRLVRCWVMGSIVLACSSLWCGFVQGSGWFDGHGQRERGLWVECHTEEFCVKVLKFESMNSQKLFIYFSFSGVVLRTIEFVP